MGLLVLSHYNNILGLNPIFYIFQQRITAVLNLVKVTAIKDLFRSEDEMKIRHIVSTERYKNRQVGILRSKLLIMK